MRERGVRERESGGGECFVQGGSVWDRVSCSFQNRDRTIIISRSNGRFGSDFKLDVSRDVSSHFVFLEVAQLRWLEGVLSTAEASKWRFPESCFVRSERRTIGVTKFPFRGVPMLKVVEECLSGQVFFVLIPADHANGWSSLVRKLREILEFKQGKSQVSAGRSYAAVVAGATFPLVGSCSKSSLDGELTIQVEEEGVQARRDFLSNCLVMRFVGDIPLRWDEFRIWMAKAWGIPSAASFLPLGDDLWLLVCSSVAETERILALKRWKFKGWDILMDVWTKTAGRSRCLEDSNVAWVVARGIPLHLRSMELFRQLGEACGGFVGAEDGLSLSTIRLRIQTGALIPDEIPISYGSEVFPVRIEAEAPLPLSAHGNKSEFFKRWNSKGKGFVIHKNEARRKVALVDPGSSSSGGCVQFEIPKVTGESSEKLGEGVRKDICCGTSSKVCSEVGRPKGGVRLLSEELSCEDGAATEILSAEVSLNKDKTMLGFSTDFATLDGKEEFCSKAIGLGLSSQDGQISGPELDCVEMSNFEEVVPNLGGKPDEITSFSFTLPAFDPMEEAQLISGRRGTKGDTQPSEIADVVVNQKQMHVLPSAREPVSPSLDGRIVEDMESIVREVATDIGLELNGSLLEGEQAAIKVCKEV
ncbi:hypothetical protein LINPERHAP2_LOCUS21703 [Linum perenne]